MRPHGAVRYARHVAIAVVALGVLAGCSSAPGNDAAAARVSAQFSTDLASGDSAAACRLLANDTRSVLEEDSSLPCPDALALLGLPTVGSVEKTIAFGRAAQSTFASDVVFLTLEPTGWRISAAGCHPRGKSPYSCKLKGD